MVRVAVTLVVLDSATKSSVGSIFAAGAGAVEADFAVVEGQIGAGQADGAAAELETAGDLRLGGAAADAEFRRRVRRRRRGPRTKIWPGASTTRSRAILGAGPAGVTARFWPGRITFRVTIEGGRPEGIWISASRIRTRPAACISPWTWPRTFRSASAVSCSVSEERRLGAAGLEGEIDRETRCGDADRPAGRDSALPGSSI